jgi:hypothetical protein
MAVLQIQALTPADECWQPVEITLCDNEGRKVTGYTALGELVASYTANTDNDGFHEVDIVPNSEIQPANTGYRVKVGRSTHLIVKGTSTETVLEALATDLSPLAPLVGAKGDPGDPGPQGIQGTPGTNGADGESVTVTFVEDSDWPPASDTNPLHWYVRVPDA